MKGVRINTSTGQEMTARECELADLSTMPTDMMADELFRDCYLAEAGERNDPEIAELLWLIDIARHMIDFATCIVDGHEWVDLSYGGPECGNIDMRCERCGSTVFTWLY